MGLDSNLDKFVTKAGRALSDSQALLQKLVDDPHLANLSEEPAEVQAQVLQLALQYRLDTQDALVKLLRTHHRILELLGIAPQHSSTINVERMVFALGKDDLHHILHALSLLVESLLRIAHRYQQNLNNTSKQKQQRALAASPVNKKFVVDLRKAIEQQQLFTSELEELGRNLDEFFKLEAIGPIFDHIAALRGPVSLFFQALQNGLEITHQLYLKTNKELQLDLTLETLLQETNVVLKQLTLHDHHHYQLFHPAKIETAERLEERAATKRLGRFFNH